MYDRLKHERGPRQKRSGFCRLVGSGAGLTAAIEIGDYHHQGMLDPSTWRTIDWPADHPPLLVVVVDTEAEFDWSARSGRAEPPGRRLSNARSRTQPLFERYGIRPTLVLDYPVSSTPEGYEFIRDLHRSGACEIGAHLQPWDNPPLVEQTTDENSFPGNLPFELEREKLIQLTHTICANIGVRPRIYKAGRYGVGHGTASILAELGYEIDVSVHPGTNFSTQFGPDFSQCGARPYWFGSNPALLEIPLSIGYAGLLANTGGLAYTLTMNERLKALHVPGILAHLRLLERIILTPEGISFDEQRRLTRALAAQRPPRLQLHLSQPLARARQHALCPQSRPISARSCDGSSSISTSSLGRSAGGPRRRLKSRRLRSNRARPMRQPLVLPAMPARAGSGDRGHRAVPSVRARPGPGRHRRWSRNRCCCRRRCRGPASRRRSTRCAGIARPETFRRHVLALVAAADRNIRTMAGWPRESAGAGLRPARRDCPCSPRPRQTPPPAIAGTAPRAPAAALPRSARW